MTVKLSLELASTPNHRLEAAARVFGVETAETSKLPEEILKAIEAFRTQADIMEARMQHNDHVHNPDEEGFYYVFDQFTLEQWGRLRLIADFEFDEKDDPQYRLLRSISRVRGMGILQSGIDLALIGIPENVSFLDNPETAIKRSIAAFEEIGKATGTTRKTIQREIDKEDGQIAKWAAAA